MKGRYKIYQCQNFNNFYGLFLLYPQDCYNFLYRRRSEKTKLVGVLIANKTDLDDRRRRVSPKVGHELATQLGLVYFECSAKDFQGMN